MPDRITRVCALVVAAIAPFVLAPTPSAIVAIEGDIDAYLERVIASGAPGVAVVVTNGEDVVVTTAGSDGHDPVDADTRFRVASLTKSFTATAVLQLVEERHVDLDQPVKRYLPEFTTADPRSDAITVRQLLNQSTGLTDGTLRFDQYAEGPRTAKDAVANLRSSKLAYDPGGDWDYCNPNYWVAARLVEVVSGETFPDYLQRHIFNPLGLTSTTHHDVPAEANNVATTHSYAFGHAVHVGDAPGFAGGAGGVVTTAADLGTWLLFQGGHRVPGQQGHVLGSDLLDEMHRRQSPGRQYSTGYALGWWNGEPADGGITRISHSGTGGGITAYQGLFPDDISIGVLANASQPRADRMAADIHSMVTGTEQPRSPEAPPSWPDVVATLFTLTVIVWCTRGVRRAHTWVARSRRLRRWLHLGALAVLPLALVALPGVGGHIFDRQANWLLIWHLAPVMTVAAWACAGCLSVLIGIRAVALLHARQRH